MLDSGLLFSFLSKWVSGRWEVVSGRWSVVGGVKKPFDYF